MANNINNLRCFHKSLSLFIIFEKVKSKVDIDNYPKSILKC